MPGIANQYTQGQGYARVYLVHNWIKALAPEPVRPGAWDLARLAAQGIPHLAVVFTSSQL